MRPLPRKVLVSLESVLALKKATLDPEFWDDPDQNQRFKSAVRDSMAKLSETASQSHNHQRDRNAMAGFAGASSIGESRAKIQ